MILSEAQGIRHLFKISYPYVIFSIAYSILIILIEEYLGDHIYKISSQVASVPIDEICNNILKSCMQVKTKLKLTA